MGEKFPINPLEPKTTNRAIPATVCGITTGKSTIPSTMLFPGKSFLARMYARGVPKIMAMTVEFSAA